MVVVVVVECFVCVFVRFSIKILNCSVSLLKHISIFFHPLHHVVYISLMSFLVFRYCRKSTFQLSRFVYNLQQHIY